ncbi:MFS transporter [Acidiphilium sp. AL]|uniref:MFS transporter n=1 Tax=Acidiphilium sp. AL TaxID=2871704 RepID=UPI0021CB912A|nr:MFS transporter [Acidiphilium sp. AL]MCU4161885.1 MFS transporter [Acidiphilium sp. AL]
MNKTADTPGVLMARIDRIPVWALPSLFAGVIGVGFLFIFFDIFDINVSFIETCSQLVPGCTPVSSAQYIGLPVLMNLAGYVVGALILSPLSDRFGRRDLLLITMVITGLGSALTAVVDNYTWFVAARAITGIGIGADLAIVNTYIGELAPRGGRARYTSMIFIFSALGAVLGIWLGLWLTTPATPLPLGLPFALAGKGFAYGWRVMYLVGAALAFIGVLLRFQLPESPRWLILRGRLDEAASVISDMEDRAHAISPLPPVPESVAPPPAADEAMPYSAIFRNAIYRKRTLLLLAMWFCAYITIYAFSAGFTTLLSALHYPLPEAGLITAIGTFGFVLCAVVAYAYGERMERKTWMPLGAAITLVGGILVALSGSVFWLGVLGSIIVFFGFNVWVPIAYAWSVENYPTRARTTGFALVDGIGHLGGGVGLIVIAPMIPHLGVLSAMLIIIGFLVLAAIIAQFGLTTRDRLLDDISP